GDQFGELAIDADQPAEPFGEGEGGDQCRDDDGDAGGADLGDLRRGQLQAEQDDGEAQHAPEREGDARFGGGRRADNVVERHAEQDRQDQRAEDRNAGNPAQREGGGRDRRGQQQAGQDRDDRGGGRAEGPRRAAIGNGGAHARLQDGVRPNMGPR